MSGSLSHENPGNQFGHAAPIFTIILLVITAVLQIICLNRGLKVYDSTLVVPVFYGIYTAVGQVFYFLLIYFGLKAYCRWLDSLIFNDEVEAYKSWTLFLIFISIIVLIAGVVLLTFKKPEPVVGKMKSAGTPRERRRRKDDKLKRVAENEEMEEVNDEEQLRGGENDVLWAVGDASDDEDEGEDEDEDDHQHPLHQDLPKTRIASTMGGSQRLSSRRAVNEGTGLVNPENEGDDEDYVDGSRMMDANRKRSMDPYERHEMHNVVGEVNGRPQR